LSRRSNASRILVLTTSALARVSHPDSLKRNPFINKRFNNAEFHQLKE